MSRSCCSKSASAPFPCSAPTSNCLEWSAKATLLGRNDADRVARRDWWLALLGDGQPLAEPLEALVARPVEQVMRAPVMTIEAQAPLHEIAEMFRVYDIKRLPVMRGGRIAGIVSRSDLVRAMATMVPSPATESLPWRLRRHARRHDENREPTAEARVSPSAAPVVAPPAITAEAFLTLVTASKQAGKDEASPPKIRRSWTTGTSGQGHAAGTRRHAGVDRVARARSSRSGALGENSFELIRFPCDLCSDGGRKIDVAETDWPTTLRGEAAEFYTRWERELRAAKFGLSAQIVGLYRRNPEQRGAVPDLERLKSSPMNTRRRARRGLAVNPRERRAHAHRSNRFARGRGPNADRR